MMSGGLCFDPVINHHEIAQLLSNPIKSPFSDDKTTMFQGGGEDIFEEPQQGDGEAENKGKSKKILKDVLQKGPPTVQVDLGDKRVSLKTPKAWKESDILVPLDPESLTTVCDFLCEDTGGQKKGGTTRLNFARKSKKGNE